jgi:hypothetical protein
VDRRLVTYTPLLILSGYDHRQGPCQGAPFYSLINIQASALA